jgi:hypothetical protein
MVEELLTHVRVTEYEPEVALVTIQLPLIAGKTTLTGAERVPCNKMRDDCVWPVAFVFGVEEGPVR